MIPRRRFLGTLALALLGSTSGRGSNRPASVPGIRPGHPRLLLSSHGVWDTIRRAAGTDTGLAVMVARVETGARRLLTVPVSERRMVGRRLLGTSREVLERVTVLAAAYRLTGDRAFARRAEDEMVAVAAFEDWNPSHFLDVGEMTAACALGYDWLYDVLTQDGRLTIRRAIAGLGLDPGMELEARHTSWHNAKNNWNQVCFGGLILGALAIGDEDPVLANRVLARAREKLVHGLEPYAPDGVYPEGPSYWSYGTTYSVVTIAALESALSTDWAITEAPGFLASAGGYAQLIGPTGLAYNFADGGEGAGLQPALMWFAQRLRDPGLVSVLSRQFAAATAGTAGSIGGDAARFLPMTLLWWPGARAVQTAPKLPLAWTGGGPNPVAVFRSAWNDPRAAYLAFKGGAGSVNHGHLDAGSFVYERDGVRWADDLGMQNYESLESKGIDLWNRRQDSERWTVFRLNNRSHNTLTLDDQLHRVDGYAAIREFSPSGATVDLTPVFGEQARTVERRFRWTANGDVAIADTIRGARAGTAVRWTLVTRAEVTADGTTARLKRDGQALEVVLQGPAGARFAVISADPPKDDFNAANPGRRRLVIDVPTDASGDLDLTVTLRRGAVG